VRPAPAAAARSAYAEQLLAARSETQVGAAWEKLRSTYPDLLASLEPSVGRTSRSGGETFYRLRAGPLPDRAAADALCKALSARQQSCFVVSPGS
jgi:cell division septation protein DedD